MNTLPQQDPGASTPPLKVSIVDDLPSARAGLNAFLSLMPDIVVVAQAADGAEALQRIPAEMPDVVIMDIEMPHMDGLEATRQLRQLGIPIRIVIMSVAFERRDQALAAGADAFINKGEPLGTLVAVLDGFRSPHPKVEQEMRGEDVNPPITFIELETALALFQFDAE